MVVYPRWRGELDRTASVVSSGSGLSPLARGTPVFANLWTIAIRFIPAGAGNTYKTRTHPPRGAVYPRWRGEHAAIIQKRTQGIGLSPLARGTPALFAALSLVARGTRQAAPSGGRGSRFIPAGAGNTSPSTPVSKLISVYPRWRGEHHHRYA